MLIKYKEYNMNEMLELLTKRHIYLSRQSSFRGVNREPDTVTLHAERDDGLQIGTISVSCNVFNNLEGVKNNLQGNQFLRSESERKFYKVWQIPFKYNLQVNILLVRVINALELARNNAPLLLYESNWYKQLQDYNKFMTSNQQRTSIDEIKQHLGCNPDQYSITNKLIKDKDQKQQYMITQYKRGLWAVWASGDEVVPLFVSESDARYFIEKRSRLISLEAEIVEVAVKNTQSPISARSQILNHKKRDLTDQVAWPEAYRQQQI